MKKEKELVKNTIIIFIGKVGTQMISFFMLPLYTAYLQTEEYGTVDLITTYIQLLIPVICIGLENGVFRFLIDYRKDKENSKKVITNTYFVVSIMCIIFSLIYVVANIFIEIKFAELIIFTIIAAIFSNVQLQISRGLGDNKVFTISSSIAGISTVLLNLLFIVGFNWGARGMILAMTLANILAGLFVVIRLKVYKYIDRTLIDKKCIKELIKYSFPLVPSGISWWIVNASDRTIISTVLGVAANGIYAVANKFSSIINILTNIFTLSWTESASMYINSEERDTFFSNIIDKAIRLFFCLCVGMMACMPLVFNILVDAKYSQAYYYIPVLLIGSLCNVMISIYSAIYVAKKLTKQVAGTTIVAAIINIAINVLFIRQIGLYAAAISTAVAYFAMMIYRHIDLKKYITLKIDYKIIAILVSVLIETMIIYYINNMYLNIMNLLFVIIVSLITNRKFLLGMIGEVKNKIGKLSK